VYEKSALGAKLIVAALQDILEKCVRELGAIKRVDGMERVSRGPAHAIDEIGITLV
jgi:hypothetical protein